MTTEGSSSGGPTSGPAGGASTGATTGMNLDADHVNTIAGTLGSQGQELRDSGFGDLSSLASAFGGSPIGQELGGNYDGAHADSAEQNVQCETVLEGFETGLRTAVQGLQETDELNALALHQIGALNPGEATSWKRR